MTNHLSHEQLCDLLLARGASDAWIFHAPETEAALEHVRTCEHCADELAAIEESLQLFRTTADNWSIHAWSQHAPTHSSLLMSQSTKSGLYGLLHRPLAWAIPAALAIAVAVPYTLHRNQPPAAENRVEATQSHTAVAQTDDALLEEIDQTLASSIPEPMQPLADPTPAQLNHTQREN